MWRSVNFPTSPFLPWSDISWRVHNTFRNKYTCISKRVLIHFTGDTETESSSVYGWMRACWERGSDHSRFVEDASSLPSELLLAFQRKTLQRLFLLVITSSPHLSLFLVSMAAGIAHSVWRIARGWSVRDSNPSRGEIFRFRWGWSCVMGIGSVFRG
jgi:hypothetical protein